jgi:hypothetical protein
MGVRGFTSFDIFGTLIGRLDRDAGRRLEKGYQHLGLDKTQIEQIAGLRKLGESQAMAQKGPDLYSLNDIYRIMGDLNPSLRPCLEEAKRAEIKMEEEQCFGISSGRVLLKEAQIRSRIIYTSDMYLPSEFIQELLEKNQLWVQGAILFVSHERGCAKHSGLFKKIIQELQISPGQLLHIGDDPRADLWGPRQAGAHSVLFEDGKDNRYEKAIAEAGLAVVADAAKAARLTSAAPPGSAETVIWETACGVAAPLFIAYVIWLRQQAKAKGIAKLYFISRDGLIFKKIYDRIQQEAGPGPASHYLYGSRQAWICARLARLSPDDISFLTLPNPTLSLKQLAHRCTLEPEDLSAPPWDSQMRHVERGLQPNEVDWIKTQLTQGSWRRAVQKKAEERLATVRQYFRQEKLGEEPYALVDLGWFGNLQEYLGAILPGTPPRHGFYLDLRKTPRIQRENRASAFLESPQVTGIDRTTAITLMEILATAPHGTCRGYQQSHGAWMPDLDPQPGFFEETYMIECQHEAILATLTALLRLGPKLETLPLKVLREVALHNFVALLKAPGKKEAEVLGGARFVSRQEGGSGVEFGPRCPLPEAWHFFVRGFRKREAAWPQAMIRRSRGLSRALLAVRYFLGQLKSKAFSLTQN